MVCLCHPYKQVEIAQKSPNGRASSVFKELLFPGNVEIGATIACIRVCQIPRLEMHLIEERLARAKEVADCIIGSGKEVALQVMPPKEC